MSESVEQGGHSQRGGASPGLRFVATAAVFSVTLFGILRIPFVEQYLLLPFTKAQHGMACRIGGDPEAPIAVGLSCSAADVIALCLGFVLAFPVAWRKRIIGATLGLVVIAAVNTVRIATLSHAVRNSDWFDLLHVYIWPGVLLIVVSIYVFLWMNQALRREVAVKTPDSGSPGRLSWSQPPVRFVTLTLFFVAVFVGTSNWWMHSDSISTVARWVAATGAFLIRLMGGEATLTGISLRTSNGSFLVTNECIMTPLIPAYFAAVFALPMTRGRRAMYLLAAFPVFFMLGAARLLVLAFPTRVVGSHLVAIHGFFQVLLAVVLVVVAAGLTTPKPMKTGELTRSIALALTGGTATTVLVALILNRLLFSSVSWLRVALGHAGHDYMDPQGALLMMAPYQLGLFVALWLAWSPRSSGRRLTIGVTALAISQIIVLFGVGEWFSHTGIVPHIAAIRAWSVVSVLTIAFWLLRDRTRSVERPSPARSQTQHG